MLATRGSFVAQRSVTAEDRKGKSLFSQLQLRHPAVGEVLAETVNHKGAAAIPGPGRGHKTSNHVLPVSDAALPKEITKMQSSRCQQLARIPPAPSPEHPAWGALAYAYYRSRY